MCVHLFHRLHHRTTFIGLVPPISLNEPRAIRSHASKEPLGAIVPSWPSPTDSILALHPELDVHDPQHEKCGHCVVQHLPISAIELRN